MDPDKALSDALAAAEVLDTPPADLEHGYTEHEALAQDAAIDELRDAFRALHHHLSRGGYLPIEWQEKQPTSVMLRGTPHSPRHGVHGGDKWGRTPRSNR